MWARSEFPTGKSEGIQKSREGIFSTFNDDYDPEHLFRALLGVHMYPYKGSVHCLLVLFYLIGNEYLSVDLGGFT